MTPKIDILAIAVHPDDAELACSGTLMHHKAIGCTTGILDLTAGEMGTRGTPELRMQEAAKAAEIMKLDFRHNLQLRDCFFSIDESHILQIVKWIRALQPKVVICNAPEDRHPDHGRAAELALQACFYSGLAKIHTEMNGQQQQAFRPDIVWHYIQDRLLMPSVVLDISPWMDDKVKAIKAFDSQFFNSQQEGPETYISTPLFWDNIQAKARTFGHMIGVEFGEGFIKSGPVQVRSLLIPV
jgi:bacillithiol biosynthesis deacetylase BshB1